MMQTEKRKSQRDGVGAQPLRVAESASAYL